MGVRLIRAKAKSISLVVKTALRLEDETVDVLHTLADEAQKLGLKPFQVKRLP